MSDRLKEHLKKIKLEDKKLGLYISLVNNDDILNSVAEFLSGGVDFVLLNGKHIPDDVFYSISQKINQLCSEFEATLIIESRADIASLIKSDAIYLSNGSLNVSSVKEIISDENLLIGKELTVVDSSVNKFDYVLINSNNHNLVEWANQNLPTPFFVYYNDIDTYNKNNDIKNLRKIIDYDVIKNDKSVILSSK